MKMARFVSRNSIQSLQQSSSNFPVIFMVILVAVIGVYFAYHNRSKVSYNIQKLSNLRCTNRVYFDLFGQLTHDGIVLGSTTKFNLVPRVLVTLIQRQDRATRTSGIKRSA